MPINSLHEFFIQLHLTERCNLRCSHCYQTGVSSRELTLNEIEELIDEVSDLLQDWEEAYQLEFSPSFNITGGEPLLRKDLFEIIEELRSHEYEVNLLTNGILIDEEKAKALADSGVKGVQVSLEGPAEIHDAIRGKGSFSASCQGVSNLVAAGLDVTLNTTLSELTAGSLPELTTISSQLGVRQLGFSRLIPSGRGAGLIESMLARGKVREIYKSISSLKTDDLRIVTGDPLASQMWFESKTADHSSVAMGGCAAGISGLTILPDGTVLPCRRLPLPLGNIREDSLREIWAGSGVLEKLRDRTIYKGKCGRCRRWAQCRGCRAVAYACSMSKGEGDFLAEDPQCFLDD